MQNKLRMIVLMLTLIVALMVAGCAPLSSSMETDSGVAVTGPGALTDETSASDEIVETGAIATVATRSLRVRQSPDAESEVVAGVREGETYGVIQISDDGQWVELAVPAAPAGRGWVSSNFVTVNGPLTGEGDAAPILVPTPVAEDEAAMDGEAMDSEVTDEAATAAIEVEVPAAGFVAVATDGTRLRVRTEPTVDSEIVGYIYNGEVYELLETSEDGTWVKIVGSTDTVTDNPDGGWVSTEFLLIGQ